VRKFLLLLLALAHFIPHAYAARSFGPLVLCETEIKLAIQGQPPVKQAQVRRIKKNPGDPKALYLELDEVTHVVNPNTGASITFPKVKYMMPKIPITGKGTIDEKWVISEIRKTTRFSKGQIKVTGFDSGGTRRVAFIEHTGQDGVIRKYAVKVFDPSLTYYSEVPLERAQEWITELIQRELGIYDYMETAIYDYYLNLTESAGKLIRPRVRLPWMYKNDQLLSQGIIVSEFIEGRSITFIKERARFNPAFKDLNSLFEINDSTLGLVTKTRFQRSHPQAPTGGALDIKNGNMFEEKGTRDAVLVDF